MKQIRIRDISTKTQIGYAPANGAAAPPVRPGWAFGGELFPKAGVLALLLGFPLGASLLTAGEQPHQPQYRFTEIALPGPGLAYGINDDGLVTGAYSDPVTGDWFSFVSERSELTTGISGPDEATYTFLGPANSRGVESGNYGSLTEQQAVLHDLRRGTFTPLPAIPGMPINFANGINDAGHVVGLAFAPGFTALDVGIYDLGMNWFWDGRHYSFITVPGADSGAWVGGINNRDQISGYYADNSGYWHGFVKDGPQFTTFDVPGADYTLVSGINNDGVVTGAYAGADGVPHGYIWFAGQAVTVDVTVGGAIVTEWYGLNDHGDLAGEYFDTDFVNHAVIAERLDGEGD
jgi:uncharacterized membrane protein